MMNLVEIMGKCGSRVFQPVWKLFSRCGEWWKDRERVQSQRLLGFYWTKTDLNPYLDQYERLARHTGDYCQKCMYLIAVYESGNKVRFNRHQEEFAADKSWAIYAISFMLLADHLASNGHLVAETLRMRDIYSKLLKNHKDRFFYRMVAGKTVALVGNGPSEIGKGLGEEIDRHDIVIRINNHDLEGYQRDYGQRTDIWAKAWDDSVKHQIDPRERCRAVLYATNWLRHPLDETYKSAIERDLKEYDVDFTDREDRALFLDHHPFHPTTGGLLVEMLRASQREYADLYGFSALVPKSGAFTHFNGDQSVEQLRQKLSGHKFDQEVAYLKSLLGGGRRIFPKVEVLMSAY